MHICRHWVTQRHLRSIHHSSGIPNPRLPCRSIFSSTGSAFIHRCPCKVEVSPKNHTNFLRLQLLDHHAEVISILRGWRPVSTTLHVCQFFILPFPPVRPSSLRITRHHCHLTSFASYSMSYQNHTRVTSPAPFISYHPVHKRSPLASH